MKMTTCLMSSTTQNRKISDDKGNGKTDKGLGEGPSMENKEKSREMEEQNKEVGVIVKNSDPKQGPLDGVQLKTNCIRTKFTKHLQKNGLKFVQKDTEANVSASMETGVFSIRDTRTDIMLSVRIEDAMAVCAAAIDAAKSLKSEQKKE